MDDGSDSKAWLYNSELDVCAESDDDAGNYHFAIKAELTANQAYYLVAGHYDDEFGNYHVQALKEVNDLQGVYYFKNLETAMYMDIHGPGEQQKVHQWPYHGAEQSRWCAQRRTDGYYTIRSEYDDKKYIGISSSTIGVDNIELFENVTTECLWEIFEGSAGVLFFKPCNQSGKVVNCKDGINGTELCLDYISKPGNNGSWTAYEYQYSYAVSNYYDEGYAIRFSNASNNLYEYQRVCSEILLEVFGIGTTRSINAYTSCADECTGTPVTLADTTSECSTEHGTTNHKSRGVIRNDLVSQFGNGTFLHSHVAWTGHALESRSSNSSTASNTVVVTIGMVTDENNNNIIDNSVIRKERIYTLLHETSHQLGAPDHYCYDLSSDNCDNPTEDCWRCDQRLSKMPDCLMSYRMYDLEEKLNNETVASVYCDQCKSATHTRGILTHLNDHHSV